MFVFISIYFKQTLLTNKAYVIFDPEDRTKQVTKVAHPCLQSLGRNAMLLFGGQAALVCVFSVF